MNNILSLYFSSKHIKIIKIQMSQIEVTPSLTISQ